LRAFVIRLSAFFQPLVIACPDKEKTLDSVPAEPLPV